MEGKTSQLAQSDEAADDIQTKLDRHKSALIVGLSAVSVMIFIGASSFAQVGFPLDDSWIHQTYARNLAETGQWQFQPEISSNGSTSPLWTLFLSFGYIIGLPHFWWAFFLGWLFLAWSGISAMKLWEALWPESKSAAVWVGLVLMLFWPLVWAAASGMETLLFTAICLQVLVVYALLSQGTRWSAILLGLLAGLLIAARPDGLILVLLVAAGLTLNIITGREKATTLLLFIGTGLLILLPYFVLNQNLSGEWWPNTLYAKQAEYAFLWDQPLLVRLGQLMLFSLGGPESGIRGISGAQLLLIPGLVAAGVSAVKKDISSRQLLQSIALIWAVGHIFIYAWRLPVTYQHGRYLWPVIPIWVIYGFAGWRQLLKFAVQRWFKKDGSKFVVSNGIKITFGVMLIIFYFLGLQAYLTDVALVNGEMVDAAAWIQEQTPEDAVVAAHDIGALGYFSDKTIIDLAGLINPDVIPYLDDEELVEQYIMTSNADYLVTAPGWTYGGITNSIQSELVYSTNYEWTQLQNLNNMTVYLLKEK